MSPAIQQELDSPDEPFCSVTCSKIDELSRSFESLKEQIMTDREEVSESVKNLKAAISAHDEAIKSTSEKVDTLTLRLTQEESFRVKLGSDVMLIQKTLENQNGVLGSIQTINQDQTKLMKQFGALIPLIIVALTTFLQGQCGLKVPQSQNQAPQVSASSSQ